MLREAIRKWIPASLLLLIGMPIQIFSQHYNVEIGRDNSPNEPSIALSPNEKQTMLVGANLNNVYLSNDGGLSWEHEVQESEYGVWGDPVVHIDRHDDYYHFHLSNPEEGSWIDRIVCEKATNGMLNFDEEYFTGLNQKKAQDKHWVGYDAQRDIHYLTWTQFDEYDSSDPADSSLIMFSRSIDGGKNWSEPTRISHFAGNCEDGDNTVEGAVPAVGPEGQVYTAWAGPKGLVFNKSTDQGETWWEKEKQIAEIPGGWNYSVPGMMRANGLPVTKCDTGNSQYAGNIYVNWTDQRNGEEDTDVWLVRSEDGGESWTDPIRVNTDEPGNHQFLTWMDVDPSTGYLWFVFYDRRLSDGVDTDVFMAVSKDGGRTFHNFKVSESSFEPRPDVFMGDYNNIAAQDGVVRPVWTRIDSTNTSIYTALVDVNEVAHSAGWKPDSTSVLKIREYPQDLELGMEVKFTLKKSAEVTVKLLDLQGRMVRIAMENKPLTSGKHDIHLGRDTEPPAPGIYIIEVCADGDCLKRQTLANPATE